MSEKEEDGHPQGLLNADHDEIRALGFTEEVETQALKVLMVDVDPAFVFKWINSLQESHWSHRWNRLIFRAIEGCYRLSQAIPSVDMIIQCLKDLAVVDDPLPEISAHLNKVLETPIPDAVIIKELMLEHAQKQDYHNLAVGMAQSISDGQYGAIDGMIKEVAARHQKTKVVSEYTSEDIVERILSDIF